MEQRLAGTPEHLTVARLKPDDLTDEHWAQLTGGDDDPFDVAAAGVHLQWRDKDHYVALLDGDRMVARAGVVAVPITAGGVTLDVVGFGGVIVAKDQRGGGLARAVMAETTQLAATLGPSIGMLFCLASRAGLYAKLGWREIPDPVAVEQPGGPHTMADRAMWLPFQPDATLPAGPVDLHSLPF